jgi:hypothetical protein
MAKRKEKRERRSVVLEPDAAGIDPQARTIVRRGPPGILPTWLSP